MKTTADICATLRRDPVLTLLVPSWTFRTVPVPTCFAGVPCLLFYFYPAKGDAGQPKTIFPPLVQVLVAKESGRVVQVVSAPLFWKRGQRPEQPLGKYPGAALNGLTIEQTDALYEQYYTLCDQLLLQTASSPIASCPAFDSWMAAFTRVKEDGFDAYFGPFVGKEDGDNRQS